MIRVLCGCAIVALCMPAAAQAETNDQRVADLLAKNLKASDTLRGFQIKVQYRDGTARLNGWVRNQQQRDEVVAIAERTPQVDRVINAVTIKGAEETAAKQPARLPEAADSAPPREVSRLVSRSRAMPAPNASKELKPIPIPLPQPPQAASANQPVAHQQPAPQHAYRPRPMAIGYTQGFTPASHNAAYGAPPYGGAAYGAHAGYHHMARAYPRQQAPAPHPAYVPGTGGGRSPAMHDQPNLPNHAWPTYAAYPNYAALTYPKQYSATAYPYIGPFYPYPQVPLGWRKVTLEWDDGWWFLDFSDDRRHCCGR